MRKFTRKPCPQILADKGQEWSTRLLERGAWTSWPQHNNMKLNHILCDEGLRDQTQAHCSYCDMTPICPPGRETIDHFVPKAGPHSQLALALEWTNLFYCCDHCQQMKREQYEDALLKPDEVDYSFDRFFAWDFDTGVLRPNDFATPYERHRAERTIALLKLNERHPSIRLDERDDFIAKGRTNLDKCCYRDFLERA